MDKKELMIEKIRDAGFDVKHGYILKGVADEMYIEVSGDCVTTGAAWLDSIERLRIVKGYWISRDEYGQLVETIEELKEWATDYGYEE